MVDIIFHVSSTVVDPTTCLCAVPAKLRAETKFVPDNAGTNSGAWALISAACRCLLVTLFILLLKATLHVVTNWHGRFLRLFFRVTLVRPRTVDRTCPAHDRGSSAGTRQGNTTSSSAPVQRAAKLPDAAGRRRKIGGKRPADDGSDAEDNDRSKRTQVVSQKDTQPSYLCPFRVFDPNNPTYLKCGTFSTWNRLREHLLDRTHKPRDRCSTCGKVCADDVEWGVHTSARACEWSPRALERPSWVERHQAASIRNLSKRGSKTDPMGEMHRKVCKILFGSESDPDRNAWSHPTWFPQSQHTDDPDMDHGRHEPWNALKRTTANLLGMQNIPRDDCMQQVIDCILSYHGYAHAVQGHEPGAGDAAADEQLGINEEITADWTPPAPPTEEQVPRMSEPDTDASGGPEGEVEHQITILSTYLSEGAGDPSPLVPTHPAQTTSAGLELQELDFYSVYVNPAQLQQQGVPHIHVPLPNDSSTFSALPSGSGTSQASEATVLGSPGGQLVEDVGCLNNGKMPDCLDVFDISVEGHSAHVGSVQLSNGRAPQQQPENWDVARYFE